MFTNGEPPVLLGNNEGANPVELLLHALAGCVTTTTVLHAAARGIRIEELSTELEGTIDLQGLLDLAPGVPAGYERAARRVRPERGAGGGTYPRRHRARESGPRRHSR